MHKVLRMKASVALLVLFAMVCQGTWVLAGTTGGISGQVIDASTRTGIPNAKVTAVSPSQTASVYTDARGNYNFLSLRTRHVHRVDRKARVRPIHAERRDGVRRPNRDRQRLGAQVAADDRPGDDARRGRRRAARCRHRRLLGLGRAAVSGGGAGRRRLADPSVLRPRLGPRRPNRRRPSGLEPSGVHPRRQLHRPRLRVRRRADPARLRPVSGFGALGARPTGTASLRRLGAGGRAVVGAGRFHQPGHQDRHLSGVRQPRPRDRRPVVLPSRRHRTGRRDPEPELLLVLRDCRLQPAVQRRRPVQRRPAEPVLRLDLQRRREQLRHEQRDRVGCYANFLLSGSYPRVPTATRWVRSPQNLQNEVDRPRNRRQPALRHPAPHGRRQRRHSIAVRQLVAAHHEHTVAERLGPSRAVPHERHRHRQLSRHRRKQSRRRLRCSCPARRPSGADCQPGQPGTQPAVRNQQLQLSRPHDLQRPGRPGTHRFRPQRRSPPTTSRSRRKTARSRSVIPAAQRDSQDNHFSVENSSTRRTWARTRTCASTATRSTPTGSTTARTASPSRSTSAPILPTTS